MFIENDTTYNNMEDYASRNTQLVWTGKDDNLKAAGGHYTILTLNSGKVLNFAGNLSWYAPSVEEAKTESLKHFHRQYQRDF